MAGRRPEQAYPRRRRKPKTLRKQPRLAGRRLEQEAGSETPGEHLLARRRLEREAGEKETRPPSRDPDFIRRDGDSTTEDTQDLALWTFCDMPTFPNTRREKKSPEEVR